MEQDKKSGNNGYELRKAAGLYWLLDLRQDGEHYKPPLAMNEMDWRLCGQHIWEIAVYTLLGLAGFLCLPERHIGFPLPVPSSANPPFYCWMSVCNPGQTS